MSLELALERPLPERLPAGTASLVYLTGTCWDPEADLAGLAVAVDGAERPLRAWGMARPDRAAGHRGPARRRAGRSGFWGFAPVPASTEARPLRLELVAALSGGGRATVELGTIALTAPEPAAEAPGKEGTPAAAEGMPAAAGGLIAVCMATFEPDPALLAQQLDSLRGQSDHHWVCVISDDHSSEASFAEIERLVGADSRFTVSRSEVRRGFYRNFERALALAPPGAALIALADQDDRWHADKLAALRAGLGDATLVYSDLRLVEADGRLLRPTLWRGRANNHDDLTSMLVANTITGAATLFRRELLSRLLPFPDTPGFQFHDTWLAAVALASGSVAYVDRPLYDYVQHPGAVFGDVTHGAREQGGVPGALARLRARARTPAWRAAYFYGYLARAAQAELLLARCADVLTPAKRRALERLVAAEASWFALAALALRPLRALWGRTETLGSEAGLAQGILWRHWAALAGRLGALGARWADARTPAPDAFSQRRLRAWRARL